MYAEITENSNGLNMNTAKNKNISKRVYFIPQILIILLSFFISFNLSPLISDYVFLGLKLCAVSIIGSVFPFLILTDLIVSFSHFERIKPLRLLFEKLFKINGYALSAFLSGVLCGFPIGVKVSSDLYCRGTVSKDEFERLICFSNNTGPAFIISGIGVSMLGNLKTGVVLYFSMLISAILVGVLTGIGKEKSNLDIYPENPDFDFVSSIKNASLNTLNICAFITFFSVISGICAFLIKNTAVYLFLLPFIEIGNASKALSENTLFSPVLTLMLISFAVSFSGISVHAQAKAFIPKELRMVKYFLCKLLQGTFSAIITFFLYKVI